MTNRFDLESEILDCWKITDDISLLEEQGANVADMTSLACVYEFKFKKLWDTFETMCKTGQFYNNTGELKARVEQLEEIFNAHQQVLNSCLKALKAATDPSIDNEEYFQLLKSTINLIESIRDE